MPVAETVPLRYSWKMDGDYKETAKGQADDHVNANSSEMRNRCVVTLR